METEELKEMTLDALLDELERYAVESVTIGTQGMGWCGSSGSGYRETYNPGKLKNQVRSEIMHRYSTPPAGGR